MINCQRLVFLGCVVREQQQAMMRGLCSGAIRYTYLMNHKKPVVEMPSTTPPKYVYEAKYHPASMPDFDMRAKDHTHFDAWLHLSFNEQEKYEYQYSGQWWEAITVPGRIFLVANIVWFLVMVNASNNERQAHKMPGFTSTYHVGDIPASHIPTLIPH